MHPDHQVVPCLACGSAYFEHLLTPEQVEEERTWLQGFYRRRMATEESLKDHAEFTQSDPVYVVRCNNCRTVFRNPQPTPAALRRLYRFDSYGKSTLDQLLDSEREFFRQKTSLVDLPTGARVLEVGSFVGAFLLAAKDRGWDATGIDIGEETCEFTRGMGLDVREGDLLGLDVKGPFDAAFIWSTFDQINEPRPLLQRLRELLKPGGLLVVRVPNGAFESACVELRNDAAYSRRLRTVQAYNNFLTFPYLCGYTPESICELLVRNGYRLQEVLGDVILPLATKDTKPCAVAEEKWYKRGVLRTCAAHQKHTGEFLYPWMDVIAVA